ncbi:rhombosortase [Bermanella marisrubri]|uniref:Uncharacterized membrane protein n=1 Tax=Bermanella marisrubri TaxID=207949 RepID=Q1N0M1_9GAMM|nr:rhombosortase [Bermanella marisrubri]EAT11812.1 uncharacterized membrane protein [Oceanobacter sp. RED65] [Bermanella marisrubri]
MRAVSESRITPLWPLIMLLLIGFLAILPTTQIQLRFDISLLQTHEWWRLISAHWVHLGWQHTVLNALGLLLIWYIAPRGLWLYWWVFYILSGLVISLVLLYQKQVANYVGASGVLHGMLLLAAYYSRILPLTRRFVFIGIIVTKVIWEQTPWYSDDRLGQVIGGYVVVDAHLWGVISGLVALFFIELKNLWGFKQKDV